MRFGESVALGETRIVPLASGKLYVLGAVSVGTVNVPTFAAVVFGPRRINLRVAASCANDPIAENAVAAITNGRRNRFIVV